MWQVTGINPLAHYLLFGVSEGRNPNPFFDSKYYLEKNPDVVATSENPLVHYLEKGAAGGQGSESGFRYLLLSGDESRCGPVQGIMPSFIIWSTASMKVDIPTMSMSSGFGSTV